MRVQTHFSAHKSRRERKGDGGRKEIQDVNLLSVNKNRQEFMRDKGQNTLRINSLSAHKIRKNVLEIREKNQEDKLIE